MMNPTDNIDQVISEANTLNLYNKLVQQLKKDLSLANIDMDIEDDISPQNLKSSLHETVFTLIQRKFNDYLNLLYIIDVPEQQIKQLDGSDVLKLSEIVAYLILKREWQKVWYKKNH